MYHNKYQEYSRIEHEVPYVYQIDSGEYSLYYYGTSHTNSITDNIFKDIPYIIESFKPNAVVVEGVPQLNTINKRAFLEGLFSVDEMSKDKDVALFSGILKCADCGSNLSHSAKVTNNNTIGYYRCSRYLNNGKTACSTHCIKESALKAFVLNDIRYHARLAAAEHELIAHELSDAVNRNGVAEKRQLEATIHELQNRLETIDKNIKSLYEDKCSGKLPEAIFNSLISGYIDEQAELSEKKSALNETLTKYKDADRDIKKWLDLVEQYKDITELTRAIVYLLIDHIEVEETANGFDGIQEVTIHYRFIGNLLNPTRKAG